MEIEEFIPRPEPANEASPSRYRYGPFGEVIRATGPMARANPFRFSTKYQDDEADLLYYGHRYYNASTGRWLSRDPIEEKGGLNVYGFVDNCPMNEIDVFGLMTLQELENIASRMDRQLSGEKCCCKEKTGIDIAFTGRTDGRTMVTGIARIARHGCVYEIYHYWWDCYTAHDEAGFLRLAFGLGVDFHLYGYTPGGATYSKTAEPGTLATWFNVGDPYNIMMDALAIYTYCGRDGYKHVTLVAGGNELSWTWARGGIGGRPPYIDLGRWVGPNSSTPSN